MKEFKGKVAVVTGAASGIGRALAARCANEGMQVVLADIEQEPLTKFAQELEAAGHQVLAVRTDVSKGAAIEELARQTIAKFGAVHLLFNNAGVGEGSDTIWEHTVADWEWVLGVDLWSVIHGIRVFVPLMLEQDTEAHIVNTASLAGLISYPGSAIYKVSKFGVVTMSETLYHELAARNAKLHVSVLCPAWVNTRIHESARNRPAELQNAQEKEVSPEHQKIREGFNYAIKHGKSPEMVADLVFEAIRQEKFWILPSPKSKGQIGERMLDILLERNPSNPLY